MRRRVVRVLGGVAFIPVVLAAACGAASDAAVVSPHTADAASWGKAMQVAGIARLNMGGASIGSMSCASPGNCSAAGTYNSGNYRYQGFVVSQVRGTWGRAEEIPGLAALNKARYASVGPISCASPGNCVAGGSYQDSRRHPQAFLVSQVHGTWRKAIEVPGTAMLNRVGAGISSVACTTPGDCTAVGSYLSRYKHGQPFVISEVHGKWGTANQVPGMLALNPAGIAGLGSLSCASAGNCTAGGTIKVDNNDTLAFVVSEVHGNWGTAVQVPGTATLGATGGAGVSSVSCASPGNCAVAGYYYDSQGAQYPFVENQAGGTFGTAVLAPGMTAFGQHSNGQLYDVSCGSPGNCSAVGSEGVSNGYDVGGGGQPFVVNEVNGTWHKASLVPGIAKLNTGVDGAVSTISCSSAGNCAAGGYYGIGKPADKVYNLQAFLVSEVNGTWGRAQQVPGLRVLNSRNWASMGQVSCSADGRCSAGGGYQDSRGGEPFVTSER
jgi:hypothetical protein